MPIAIDRTSRKFTDTTTSIQSPFCTLNTDRSTAPRKQDIIRRMFFTRFPYLTTLAIDRIPSLSGAKNWTQSKRVHGQERKQGPAEVDNTGGYASEHVQARQTDCQKS
jgi:hypothetical protein